MSLARLIIIFIPFLSVIIGIYSLRTLSKPLKAVFLFVCLGFITELLNWIAVKTGIRNTIPMLHFYIMVEFLLWSLFYENVLSGLIKNGVLWCVIIVFELVCIINMIFIQNLTIYPFTRIVEGILIILYSLVFFYKLLVDTNEEILKKVSELWINAAVLIFFAGLFFFNIVFTPLLEENAQMLRLLSIYVNTTLSFILYLGISIGFIVQKVNINQRK